MIKYFVNKYSSEILRTSRNFLEFFKENYLYLQ